MEPKQDHLVRYAPFDLRRPHGSRRGWRTPRGRQDGARLVDSGPASDREDVRHKVPADDIDPNEVTEVLLYAAAFLGFVLLIAVGAAGMFALSALWHWK